MTEQPKPRRLLQIHLDALQRAAPVQWGEEWANRPGPSLPPPTCQLRIWSTKGVNHVSVGGVILSIDALPLYELTQEDYAAIVQVLEDPANRSESAASATK